MRAVQNWVIKILIKASGGILKRGADNSLRTRPRGPRDKMGSMERGTAKGPARRAASERQNGTELTGYEEGGNSCRSLVYNRGI